MIWAILAILGVPIWLILGALGATLWSRRKFRSQPGVFPLATRPAGTNGWPRMPAYGRIISDVIVFNRGLALQRTTIHQIRDVHDLALDASSTPKSVGEAMGRVVDLDDDTTIEVAFPAEQAAQFNLSM